MKLGTVDFYPGQSGTYGQNQPGCSGAFKNIGSCSHSRAHQLYLSSITNGNCKAIKACNGDPVELKNKDPKNCWGLSSCIPRYHNPKDNNCKLPTMGYWTDSSASGLWTVDTKGSEPYCA